MGDQVLLHASAYVPSCPAVGEHFCRGQRPYVNIGRNSACPARDVNGRFIPGRLEGEWSQIAIHFRYIISLTQTTKFRSESASRGCEQGDVIDLYAASLFKSWPPISFCSLLHLKGGFCCDNNRFAGKFSYGLGRPAAKRSVLLFASCSQAGPGNDRFPCAFLGQHRTDTNGTLGPIYLQESMVTKPGHYNVLALLPEDNTYAQLPNGRINTGSVDTYMLMN